MISPELAPGLKSIPSPLKRGAVAALYIAAAAQREYAESRLDSWKAPTPRGPVDAHLVTLACYRDRLLLMRMVASFLSLVGRPKAITIVCHDDLGDAVDALRRFDAPIECLSFAEYADRENIPPVVRRFAQVHGFGRKLAVLMKRPAGCPVVYTDTDIEFFQGGYRLAELLRSPGRNPWYLYDVGAATAPGGGYDERLLEPDQDPVIQGVNGGFCVFPTPVDWDPVLDRLKPAVDTPLFLTEQTVVAMLMTQEHAWALPSRDYILSWDDSASPIDRHRGDTVMRHYASPVLRWKLWLRGGHRGMRTLPMALAASALRRFRPTSGGSRGSGDSEGPPLAVVSPDALADD